MKLVVSAIAVAALTGAVSADWFTFAGVADNTVVSQAEPLNIVDLVDSSLVATVSPNSPFGSFTKVGVDGLFPAGTGGSLVESVDGFAAGLRITFNKPVFCVPGFIIGEPGTENPIGQWTTYYESMVVDTGNFAMTIDPVTGLATGSVTLPEAVIDSIDVRAFNQLDGLLMPTPMRLGDFFAEATLVCVADFDLDASVTSNDFFAFLEAFFAGQADVTGDGQTTSDDYFTFLDAFFAGC